MRLIERRIGFLFAVFLALLAIGFLKAAWLGVVKAGSLKRAAATQQKTDVVVPARRGAIMDREGTELAVSQPAVTIAATPYLVKDAGGDRDEARAAARQARGRADQAARAARHRVRLPRPPDPDRDAPSACRSWASRASS